MYSKIVIYKFPGVIRVSENGGFLPIFTFQWSKMEQSHWLTCMARSSVLSEISRFVAIGQ